LTVINLNAPTTTPTANANKPIAAPTGVAKRLMKLSPYHIHRSFLLMMWLISYQHHQLLVRATKPPIPPLNKLIPWNAS
jgi:hypothetical protein